MQEEEGELFFWTGAMVAEKKEERGWGENNYVEWKEMQRGSFRTLREWGEQRGRTKYRM